MCECNNAFDLIGGGSRVRQLGCPIAQGNQFLVWATNDLHKNCPNGQVHIAYTNLVTQITNIKNHVLISYKPSANSNFLTLHINMFCCLGKQFYDKLARPGNQEKENCRSLGKGEISMKHYHYCYNPNKYSL